MPYGRLEVQLPAFLTSAWMEVSDQFNAPAAFYPQEKRPQYPFHRRLSGPESQSGQWQIQKNPFPASHKN